MDNDGAPDLAPHAKTSLLAIPTELLDQVTRMCSDQDQAFRHRVKLTLKGDLRSPEVETMLNVQEMLGGLGGSLKALSRVCSVLNAHAAPYIFHTLQASRFGWLYQKQHSVPTNKLRHFQHLVLDSTDETTLQKLLESLDHFSKLSELTLHWQSIEEIFGGGPDAPNPRFEDHLAWSTFKRKATTITSLHLIDFDFNKPNALEYLELFPNLTTLSIRGNLNFSKETAARLVACISKLDKLVLHDPRQVKQDGVLPEAFFEKDLEWPELRILDIQVYTLRTETIDFINKFANSLVELHVSGSEEAETAQAYGGHITSVDLGASPSFPELKRIEVLHSHFVADSVFKETNRITFPSLSHVRISHGRMRPNQAVLEYIWKNHSIKSLQFDPSDQDLDYDWSHVREQAELHQCRVTFMDCPEGALPHELLVRCLGERDTVDERDINRMISFLLTIKPSSASHILKYLRDMVQSLAGAQFTKFARLD